jgi:tetratricopeptide (TPR) repeat protein
MSTTLERGILIVIGIVIAFLLIRMFLIIFILLVTPEGETYKYGVTMGNRGDWHGAIVHFDRVIEMNPNHEKAYASRAYAKLQTGDHAGAVDDSTKATQMSPYYGQAYAFLGLAELKSGNNKVGCEKLNEAYDLGYLEANYYLSEYCE